MFLSFPLFKLKEKVTIFLVILFLLASLYFYLNHLQRSYNSAQWSGERCVSELTSIKYQLSVVTEYKNRIDKLLTETQKAHDTEKERCKDVMDSCVAMKQQTAICQKPQRRWTWVSPDGFTRNEIDYVLSSDRQIIENNQFEDLQIECKKVREDYNKAIKELKNMKSAG